MWKHSGDMRTPGITEDIALEKLTEGLRSGNNGYIYHCHDHYCCPMGYEITSTRPQDAYTKLDDINKSDQEYWIYVGEPSRCFPTFHIRKWKDIAKDI